MSKRLVWADLLRILAIYLVIVVHSTQLQGQLNLKLISVFISFAIAKTCVPLFFMLSGALLLSKNEKPSSFYKKRLFRIFYPWFFWTIVFFIFLKFSLNPQTFSQYIDILKTSFRVFWFIPIIGILYLVTPTLRTFLHHASSMDLKLIISLWYLIIFLIPYFHNTLAFPLVVDNSILRQVINFSGYYLLGYSLIRLNYTKKQQPGLIIMAIGILWSVIGAITTSISAKSIQIYYFDYLSPSTVLLSIGIFITVYIYAPKLGKKLSKDQKSFLSLVSSTTLGIYFLETLHVQIFEKLNINFQLFHLHPFINGYINAFVIFTFCLTIILLLQKIKILKKFVS